MAWLITEGRSVMPREDFLFQWNGLQNFLLVGFGSAAAFWYRVTFRFVDVGRLPIPPWSLFVAEIPATLTEGFPLLALAGVLGSNVALLVRGDVAAYLVPGVVLLEIIFLVSVVYLAVSLLRRWQRLGRRYRYLLVGLSGLGVAATGFDPLRSLVALWVRWSPISLIYESLFFSHDFRARESGFALLGVGLVLFGFWGVTRLHYSGLLAEMSSSVVQDRKERARDRGLIGSIQTVFERQLLDSDFGRLAQWMPLLFSAPIAWAVWTVNRAFANGEVVPKELQGLLSQMDDVPLLALLWILILVTDSAIWMNQFGWERRGVRTLLMLPISAVDLLRGHGLGVVWFVLKQLIIGTIPLLFVVQPSVGEWGASILGFGTVLLVVLVVGHYCSLTYPRSMARKGSASVPLFLSLISMLAVGLSCSFVIPILGVGNRLGWWLPCLFLAASCSVAAWLYWRILVLLALELIRERERLLRL